MGTMFSKSYIFAFLLIMCWAGIDKLAMAAVIFKVDAIEGDVKVFYPGDFEAKNLSKKTKYIYSGAMVEVLPNAKLEISQYHLENLSKRNLGSKIAKIRLNLPSLLRLDENTLRTYRTKPYPIKTLLSVTKKEAKPVSKKPVLDLMNAFQRSMVELTNPDYIPKLEIDPEVKTVDTAIKVEELKILMPTYDSLFYIQGENARIPILWEKRESLAPFSVFLWKEGESKGPPYTSTDTNSYLLRIKSPGSYFIQVVSEDRKVRSKKIRISIDPEKFASGKWDYPKDFLARRKRPPTIELEFPIEELKLFSALARKRITFTWNDSKQSPPYVLQVLKDGKVMIDQRTNETHFSTSLTPGYYSWVVSYGTDNLIDSDPRPSKTRSFELGNFEKNSSEHFAKVLTQVLESGQDATYYWDY